MTRAALVATTAVVAFGAGVAVDSWLRVYGPPQPAVSAASTPTVDAAPRDPASRDATPAPAAPRMMADLSRAKGTAGAVTSGKLRMPIDGVDVESLKGGFAEARTGHPHEAVDILAPRNTPIHAVDDGMIAKLFVSKAGGLTVYQFDPATELCYYYAHLERYADDLHEGNAVRKGDLIGYVGTSGNAPKNTPHLHFAVFHLDERKHWWQGTALDPYRVFKERG
jgi:peptidoglycan LD-endopeptidase LytH